jgi:hypothetical protein
MSKEDRYAHLGDGIEATTDGTDADDGTLRVTIEDGDETTVLTVDPEAASAEDIREAIGRASGGRRSADPGRLALELGTLGPRLALKGVESLVEGLDPNRRDRE